MLRKRKGRRISKSKVKVEKSSAGRVDASKEGSEGFVAAVRPPVTSAQLDARQRAIKPRRKASGPLRKAKSHAKVSPSSVPPVKPR